MYLLELLTPSGRDRGAAIARLLERAWDADPGEATGADVSALSPLLLGLGAAPLAWWRMQRAPAPGSETLQQAFHLQLLNAALYEAALEAAYVALSTIGIEPLLGKGWAIARAYPETALRPYGDLDLYLFDDAEFRRAQEYLTASAQHPVDLHLRPTELSDRSPAELRARSSTVTLGRARVRLFAPEDHLRLLALHALRHTLARPLWLCDLAVALEARPPDFDWRYFLSGDPRRTDWVIVALKLAEALLQARLDGAPQAVRARRLPSWLVYSILSLWGDRSFLTHGRREPFAIAARTPRSLVRALVARWPTPLEATIGGAAALDDAPRLPLQLAECVRRLVAAR